MSEKSYLEILKDSVSSRMKKGKEPEVLKEADPKVKIPVEKGDLGLSLDAPLSDYKAQITSGRKKWEELSQQINTLFVFNKDKHPDIAKKASDKREALAKWVEGKRKDNFEFGK